MNKAARAARKRKVAMWQRYKHTQSYEDLVEYKLARKQAAREYREAKRSFELNLAKEIATNPKSFYAYIRSKKVSRILLGHCGIVADSW
jgi:hypothetical protein